MKQTYIIKKAYINNEHQILSSICAYHVIRCKRSSFVKTTYINLESEKQLRTFNVMINQYTL